jgi:hypothetical protein
MCHVTTRQRNLQAVCLPWAPSSANVPGILGQILSSGGRGWLHRLGGLKPENSGVIDCCALLTWSDAACRFTLSLDFLPYNLFMLPNVAAFNVAFAVNQSPEVTGLRSKPARQSDSRCSS